MDDDGLDAVDRFVGRLSPTFLQNIQHEIRTPLAVVMGYTELLCEGELGALTRDQQRVVSAMAARIRQLRNLLEQVSVLLDVEAGQSAPGALDLSVLVEDAACRWRCFAKPGPSLEARLQAGVAVDGDAAQLSRAIDCLLDNAKFTPRGGRVELSLDVLREMDVGSFPLLAQTVPARCWARLSVSDTGIGMSERDVERLLDGTLFYQADGGLGRCYPGCGLGLTLVKAVACLHAGWLEIGSQLGQGSCFTLMLPARPAGD